MHYTLVVGVGDSSETFLSRRIPNLQFDALVLQVERFKAEVHSNGRHVVLTELVVGES
jgi:hypothetical protein